MGTTSTDITALTTIRSTVEKNREGRAAFLGLTFGVMGALKLLGLEGAMFRRWGMTPHQMRVVGLAETAGGLMMARRDTRPLTAAGLTAVSAIMLALEARNGEVELVLPRLGLLLVAAREAAKP